MRLFARSTQTEALTMKPVSYTHLDVYKRQGYSEEYLDAYSLHLYAYADAGIEKETAEEWAKKTCDLLIGK